MRNEQKQKLKDYRKNIIKNITLKKNYTIKSNTYKELTFA